ncbi:hypothetical protein ACHAXT_008506 [Thalassiosira profunda]
MKLSPLALPLLLAAGAEAFVPPSSPSTRRAAVRSDGSLAMSSGDAPASRLSKKKVLTPDDVMAKSKSMGTTGGDPLAPGAQEAPKIFTEEIYDDFQSALLLLERRVKEGPGSVSAEDVTKFEGEAGRIVAEMREYMADPKGVAERIRLGYEESEAAAAPPAEPAVTAAAPAQPAAPVQAAPVQAAPVQAAPVQAVETPAAPDPLEETAPEFEGKGSGYGLAQGTTNTYLIPNMDEMSPEEYRAKLQETVSARQAQRRKESLEKGRGIIGNAGSQGYLDMLGGGSGQGAPGNKQGENNPVDRPASFGRWKTKMQMAASNVDEGEAMSQQQQEQQEAGDVGSDDDAGVAATGEPLPVEATADANENDNGEWEKMEAARVAEEEERAQWLAEQNRLVAERLEARQQSAAKEQQEIAVEARADEDVPPTESSLPEVEEEPPSPFLSLRQRKFAAEDSRKSEWQKTSEGVPVAPPAASGRYNKSRTSKFSYHHASSREKGEGATPASAVASRKVSKQSTKSFAHGNEEDSQRPMVSFDERNVAVGYFQKHVESTKPSQSVLAADAAMSGQTGAFADDEKRQRPVPTSDQPVYAQLANHRGAGDTRKPSARSQPPSNALGAASAAGSLVDTEERVRPIPTSNLPEYAQVQDHRSAGDIKSPGTRSQVASGRALWSKQKTEFDQHPPRFFQNTLDLSIVEVSAT